MAVLTTMVLVSIFGDAQKGLLNPAWLREQIEDELEDSPSRAQALALVDKLDRIETRHNEAVRATLDEYVRESRLPETDAEDLVELLEPRDRDRLEVLEEAIAVRQSLLELLDEDEWDAVFDN